MPTKPVHTKVDGRKIKLTNIDKLLFEEQQITKAEVVEYYLRVAEVMLPHIKNRPLTLIRFPDGAENKQFYSKNKPEWTPNWIASTIADEEEDNEYILANEKATLAWLGNLSALEIHPMNVRSPNLEFPDQFIFDLDPSEQYDFDELKTMALELKDLLIAHDYKPYLKTSGGKGLHIYCPIFAKWDKDTVFTAVQQIAKEYVKHNTSKATLTLSKAKRKGKVLIDIYRNRSSNTCVAPYSLRGRAGAPVSMPITWEELKTLKSAQQFSLRNVAKRLQDQGDAWDEIWKNQTPLHTADQKERKKLATYNQKRDFEKTAEPRGNEAIETSGHDYVVQLHDASNLHFDLRLEENGVLTSWALPKGLPHKIGVKRLAVRTEDHPLKYINFEGIIPKGEYGGGTMWVFDQGQFELIEKKEKKYHFHLQIGKLSGEYLMYNTKKNQWIIERRSEQSFKMSDYVKPMLAEVASKVPSSKSYSHEIKWDGIRAILFIDEEQLTIFSRNGNDITAQFPELAELPSYIDAQTAVLDAEIVFLEKKGKPNFSKIVGRLHIVGEKSITKAAKKTPATLYLFDLLYLDGKDCRDDQNSTRREWLQTVLTTTEQYRFSESFEDGKDLFNAIAQQGMEGIICKKQTGKYRSGKRTKAWLKVKVRHTDEAMIIGYTKGEGSRARSLGALHLAKLEDGVWNYYGKVGTGFNDKLLQSLHKKLSALPTIKKPISQSVDYESDSIWVEAMYRAEIEYASLTPNGTYREPVFKKLVKESEAIQRKQTN